MTSFWILALVLCAAAAGFILVPLFMGKRKQAGGDRTHANVDIYEERLGEIEASRESGDIDAEEFEVLKTELQKTLLDDTAGDTVQAPAAGGIGRLPIVLAVLVPVFALFAYSSIGLGWGQIGDVALAHRISQTDPHNKTSMQSDVEKLASQLQREPDNDQGWFLLAQSYMNLEVYGKAADSFQHLLDKYPQDYNLLSYYAEAVYLADNRQVTPRVHDAIQRTLKVNPHDISSLEILGMDAYSKGDYDTSLAYFRKALVGKPDKDRAEMIKQAIAGIEKEMKKQGMKIPEAPAESAPAAPTMQAGNEAPPSSGTSTAAGEHRSLSVLVEVGDDVQAPKDASVFVFAKAVGGPPMPLAVQRLSRTDLPKLVKLDDTMGMIQGMSLANFNNVEVVARISSSGIANASPDDYEAHTGTIDLTKPQSVIKLKIEHKRKELAAN